MDLHVAAIKPNSQKETLIPNMIKCRTCLEQADECTSVNIVTECTLGRTIKDILLLFIPGMVTSPLIGEFICCKCTRRIRNFTNFIEKCLSVEKILIEENAKAQKEIIKQSAPVSNSSVNTPLSLVYITVPQVNQNGVQNGAAPLQPIQIQSIPLKFVLQPTNSTALGNDIMPVSQTAHQNTSQNQFIIVPEIKSCSVDTRVGLQPQINSNHSIQIDKTELNNSPQKRKQSDLISSATGNRFCRTCGDVFMSDDWSMVECSKCATTEKDIEMNLSDVPSNYFDNGDDSSDLEMTVEKDSNTLAKEADLMKEVNSVFKNLRSEFRDTIISVRQPSEQIDKILEEFTKSNIKIIEYGPYNHIQNKRIMFLGNSSSQCSECKVLLKNPKALKVHFQDAHTKQELHSEEEDEDVGSNKTFQCPFCDVRTTTPLLLVGHLRVMHRVENPFMCEKCSKTFRKRDIYLEHIKRYENSPDCSLRKCRFCEEMLNKGQLEIHLKSHRNLVCDQCGKSFSGVNTFKAHYATHQGDDEKSEIKTKTEHLCPICGKLLSNVQSYKHHMTTHEQRTRNYICHMCPKTFLTLHYLKSHITKSHVESKIVCTICGIKVKTRGALINHHNLKHAETYAYECNICGKGFSRGDYYKRHMKRHAGPIVGRGPGKKKYNFSVKIESKPVKCKYCLKIFKNVYLLRSHLLSHVKNMRYKCKFCDMTLANTATRFRHQKRHADPNFDLSCTICWRRMDNKEKLQAHLSVHEQSKKYKCVVCNELFCSKYLLRHHISEQHIAKEEIEMEKEIVLSNALEEFLL